MSLSKSKCWYSNDCLHFLKCAVSLELTKMAMSIEVLATTELMTIKLAIEPITIGLLTIELMPIGLMPNKQKTFM